ncbi:reverse transcriptase domain-containing protein [Tanacetum coccineum]
MSSPTHLTSDVEDGFSSNFLNYLPVSPDYFPALPRNTSSLSKNGMPPKTQQHLQHHYDQAASGNYAEMLLPALEAQAAKHVFSRSNCTEDCKVKFATGTLTEDAMSWWNSYAKPIGIEKAEQIAWTELKRLLTNKYCPRTEVRKMEDEFYNLVVKGNDLKTYARRFQELATLCPNMVPNNEKLMEVFIGGLPQSIEGTITASKP